MAVDSKDAAVVSRREWLKRVSAAGAAVAVPAELVAQPRARPEPLETLTEAEAVLLDAIVARLIPTDATGPGATEARAARYIDRALGGALASSRDAYRTGLAALDAYARASKGTAFTALSAQNQDAVLGDLERNVATGFTPDAATFFNLVLAHTLQGTFCDPFYGGNADFVGWTLIGYPGVRLAVTAGEQQLDASPKPTRMSAYDYTMFSKKKPARAAAPETEPHHAG
jgi:gluconate 2-dehydrogenase gamma chain